MRKGCLALVVGLVVVLGAAAGMAAEFPNKPIQLIVPYSAGGSTDVLARAIGQVAPRFFPQPVVIVNKAGGGGIPGRVDVVKAKNDGYTQLFGWGSGEDLVVPHQRPLPYDVFKDFETVCRISVHSIVLAVPANSPHKTLADLVKFAKTKEYVTAAVSTKGGSVDITFLLFGKAAGIKVTTVPGSGGSDAITKLVGGHVDFGGGHPSEVLPHIKAGRLRGLAVAFEKRDASVPDIPTFRESGYDVVTAGSVKGVAVPKGTPKEIIGYLEKKYKDIAVDAEFQKIMKDLGQPVMYQTAEEYKVWFKQAYDQFGELVKSLEIETK
ncbi:MAG TPA: tripartite tricarboxylate transporter substrate binding protein [Candidatus Methylomirabilis sp.]|nr:tripartite tricarboxylate transporter substrate binding protein [Candidatus Methylomirabilis sp.]